ncbi:hypothetical protein BOTCAL_0126g00220 [Botryotinia calthae]|uniref:Uncharacterized protein n=1 Tax=Botryotinia calthae TaxID=38488 RepID=A0A4Y8D472_9HELO|nr:hypothetical protein BOTCAL_0126g00220 [Botryotinia calthae]
MCNMEDELMSLEEVGRLMDEQEMNNTMATSVSTAVTPSTVAITATATTSKIISEASNKKISGAILFKEPDENQQTPSLPKTTPGTNMSKRSGVRARQREAKPDQKLSKISVCITENREAHQNYSMERIPWTDQPESESSTYFDNASLAKQAVYISFDESEGSGAVSSPATRMENSANFTPIKPVTPHLSTQQPIVGSFVPTTLGRDESTSSSHLSGQLDKPSSVATRIPGGPREVITISFPDIGALSSGLKSLNAAKDASAGGTVVSINGPIGGNQVEISGSIGSNIRGFVRKTCPRLSEKQIKAAFK